MADSKSQHRLTFFIALAIVLAIITAMILPAIARFGAADAAQAKERAGYILVPLKLGGEVFLRVLKMLVVPLVMSSVMTGVLGLGDVRKLGRPGLVTIVYYLATTMMAVLLGIVLVNLIHPGQGAVDEQSQTELKRRTTTLRETVYSQLATEAGSTDDEIAKLFGDQKYVDDKHPSVSRVLENLVLMMFTDNIIKAAVNMDLLPLIVFSIAFAGLLTVMGERVSLLKSGISQLNDAFMSFVLLVMRLAPFGIFCLVAGRFGQANVSGELWNEILKTGWYSATVLIGLAVHAGITLPAILYLFTRRNPYRFILQMSRPLLTAFSTASSSATLPITIETAIDEAGVSRKSADFVLPLGATINMDGTALYEAVAAIFIAQVIGAEMGLAKQAIVAMTATLAAIGAAGIPEAGLVTMVIVLNAVGLPIEYISLILSVDWLLDRFRTAVNVFGDAVGAAVVDVTFRQSETMAQ